MSMQRVRSSHGLKTEDGWSVITCLTVCIEADAARASATFDQIHAEQKRDFYDMFQDITSSKKAVKSSCNTANETSEE